MNEYFAYIRVSTVKQGERGTSLHEQRSAIEAYAKRDGLSISVWFEEMETAAKQGRGQFTRMLVDLRKGNAKGVIIHKIDRSARNLKDWAQIGDLIDAGVDIQKNLRSRAGDHFRAALRATAEARSHVPPDDPLWRVRLFPHR